jgi:hypothetical protein
MKRSKHEKGQALIIIVLAIFGLVGLTGLTIDGGNVYSDRRHAQNAADAAAYAAALTKVRDGNWQAAGLARAADNDYDNNGTSNIVQVISPPISGSYAGNPDYIQVIITSHVDTYFARVVGINQMTNRVNAVAKTKLSGIGPLFDGEALVSLKETGSTFTTCGNPNVNVTGSGIFVNSSSDCAMNVVGNVNLEVDEAYSIVNPSDPVCTHGNISMVGELAPGADQIDYPPDIYLAAPSIECTGSGSYDSDTNTFYPGNYNSITVNSGTQTFSPGNYCFNGDVRFNGGDITANYVSFRINDGDFSVNGNATFTADNMIVFSTDTADGMHFNGNGDVTATNTTFYMESGAVEWNGNANNTFTAPTSGPNANMLIYMPLGNASPLTINGNADSTITGTIVGLSAHVTVNGNSSSNSFNSQIVGYTVEACGNADLNISFDPGDNFQQQEPAKIELTE